MEKKIVIKGARENNLKNIDVSLPKDSLIVFSGLSGSGKSTLAFDTIFAEGQRRYVESLSSYARQFLGNFDKPDVDAIEGLLLCHSASRVCHSHGGGWVRKESMRGDSRNKTLKDGFRKHRSHATTHIRAGKTSFLKPALPTQGHTR